MRAAILKELSGYGNSGYVLTSPASVGAQPTWAAASSGAPTQAQLISAGAVVVLARSATPVAVSNTTTPTDVIGYAMPAATLSANRKIVLETGGTYVNNSAAPRNFTFALSLGGTTLYSDVTPNFATSALVRTWEARVTIAAESNTLVHVTGWVRIHTTNVPDNGLGAIDNILSVDANLGTAAAGQAVSDLSSASRTLSLTITHGTNNATQTFTRTHYSIELKP